MKIEDIDGLVYTILLNQLAIMKQISSYWKDSGFIKARIAATQQQVDHFWPIKRLEQ